MSLAIGCASVHFFFFAAPLQSLDDAGVGVQGVRAARDKLAVLIANELV